MKDEQIIFLGLLVLIVVAFLFYVFPGNCKKREHYRDPIYLNRAKMMYDWYPRSNGSIYGWTHDYGGSWDIFSGYPYYDRAY